MVSATPSVPARHVRSVGRVLLREAKALRQRGQHAAAISVALNALEASMRDACARLRPNAKRSPRGLKATRNALLHERVINNATSELLRSFAYAASDKAVTNSADSRDACLVIQAVQKWQHQLAKVERREEGPQGVRTPQCV